MSRPRVAIIGGGLAAHATAATLVAHADVVMVYPDSPGQTALWSGWGQIFGPAADPPGPGTGSLERTAASRRPRLRRRRAERFAALGDRRPDHPYVRLGLGFEALAESATRAVEALGYPGLLEVADATALPSPAGAPALADLAAPSVAASAIRRGDRVGVVGCQALTDWAPERIARAIAASGRAEASVVQVGPLAALGGDQQHPVRLAARLATEWGPVIDAVADAAAGGGFDLMLLPGVFGGDWPGHVRLWTRLSDAVGCRIAELAHARHSVHGWRLDRWLRAWADNQPRITRVDGAAVGGRTDGGQLVAVETAADEVEADAFVLATGAMIGGGLPDDAPFVEPVLGLALWLDGAPLDDDPSLWPPDYLGPRAWSDHPLARAGLAIDAAGRPLDRDGQPAFDNLWATGRALGGTDPALDGTSLGVDLAVSHRVGEAVRASLAAATQEAS